MVVIDEKSRVPAIDEPALERLSLALNQDGVVAAMLIGSRARGTPGPLSDVDIAVWHDQGLDPASRLRLQLNLASAASRVLGTDEIDIVMLNKAPPLLDNLDTKPLRAEMSRGLRKRIQEVALVDAESIDDRLEHLAELLVESERIRAGGRETYDASLRDQLAAQHAVQFAIQICADRGGAARRVPPGQDRHRLHRAGLALAERLR